MIILILINLIILDYYVYKVTKTKNKLVGTLNYTDLDEEFWRD